MIKLMDILKEIQKPSYAIFPKEEAQSVQYIKSVITPYIVRIWNNTYPCADWQITPETLNQDLKKIAVSENKEKITYETQFYIPRMKNPQHFVFHIIKSHAKDRKINIIAEIHIRGFGERIWYNCLNNPSQPFIKIKDA